MKCHISPIRHIWALLLLCLCAPLAFAQQPLPCSITITSDFESQCILPRHKDDFVNEEPETIIACQGNIVTYTAHVNTGAASVTEWNWEVAGGILSSSANIATVEWGTEPQGQISLTIVTDSGSSCSLTINVRLIEKPSILVSTVPSYSELPDGSKVIYVCRGETIEFTDLSSTVNTDIVGYFWDSPFYNLTASTPNFRIENVWHDDQVTHRVYNNCGCFDEEVYSIKVLEGLTFDLGCYGTVCQDAVVTYTANNPPCSQYSWYVEGGTIIGAQDRPSVTVQWDNPQNGYGIIGLDGNLCGGNACPSMLSKKIPIIQKGVAVKGQDVVCVDEAVIYSVPLYGSTEYHWSIQPTTGISLYDVNGANQQMVEFHQPGIYHLHVSYKCDFLECGEFSSDTLTIHVKPRLSITGHDRICINNPCDLTTDPSAAVSWEVQDISNNYQSIHSETSNVLSWTFPHTGKYQVTASHPDYCRPAILIVTVVDAPPAPTIDDMDPENPTRACLGSSIHLNAVPSNPDYSIVWIPSCESAYPDTISGNEVTISYADTQVCDIFVYNYDRVLGCMSDSHYVHPVLKYAPLPLNLPDTLVVCPGTEIVFDNTEVPNESGMIYRWTMQQTKQYCASVQGDSVNFPNVRIIVNNLLTPDTFFITLTRSFCPNIEYIDTIYFVVKGADTSHVCILGDSVVCEGSTLSFLGVFCSNDSLIDSGYYWKIGDSVIYDSNSISYRFNTVGNTDIQLFYRSFDYCSNEEYLSTAIKHINVVPLPSIDGIRLNANNYHVELVPPLDPTRYSFVWSYNSTQTTYTNNYMPYQGYGTYSCTITRQGTPCSRTYSFDYDGGGSATVCDDIGLSVFDMNYCTKELTLTTNHNILCGAMVSWSVGLGRVEHISYTNSNRYQATYRLTNVGDYIFHASCNGNPCHAGTIGFTLDFIPDFWIEKKCDSIVIHNNSKYLDDSKLVYITINSNTIQFPVSQPEYSYHTASGSYTIALTGYDTPNSISNCIIDNITISNVPNATVSITSPWGDKTCDNTAMELEVTLVPNIPYQYISWDFGDGSSLQTTNNLVSHTYKQGDYNLTVSVVNMDGCSLPATIEIESLQDNLKQGDIVEENNTLYCPYSRGKKIFFSTDLISPYANNDYCRWYIVPTNVLRINAVFYPDYTSTYYVYVENLQNHCRVEKNRNIAFLNAPTANISTSSDVFCANEKVMLYGAQSPDTNSYTFQWTVFYNGLDNTLSNPVQTDRPNSATNSFTPTTAGWYTLEVSISNDECPAVGQKSIYVNPTPAAPTISFGSNECIDNPPVVLNGSAPSTSDINWSNGNVGPNAYYFSPGMATAWYYDPNTGCKSEEAKIHIEPQPDFDALLTGCYEKCRAFFETNPRLPVWGLSSGRENIRWKWCLNATGIANGIVSYPNYSLSLPLQGFGDYNLNLDYHNGNCGTLISPTLTINPKDTCDCQDLDVSYICKWHVEDCKIFYDVDVMVCNNSNTNDCLRNIEYLFNKEFIRVVYTDFASTTLNPGDCYSFHMTILASQFLPSSTISFRLYDECNNCTTDFSINLMPEKIDCEMDMQLLSLDINPGLSSSVAAYFDFNLDVSPCQNLIAFWTEPPMVINYWYDGAAMVQGLGMVDYAALTQLMAENGNICFYAITCEGDHLCKRKFCLSAEEIFNSLLEMGLVPTTHTQDSKTATSQQSKTSIQDSDAEPHLMPNPTTGEVNVIGTADKVIEVLVMDMNGRQMATFVNAKRFNIAHLATGHYIVRLKTQHNTTEKVTYLKLIKQ